MTANACSVPECDRVERTRRGWCKRHYDRWRLHGDPLKTLVPPPGSIPALERFMSYVDISGGPDACHPWTAARNRYGYGRFGKTQTAHRWILGHLRGEPLRPEQHALHHCDNPPCVNPKHLYVGTPAQNMRDKSARGRAGRGNADKTHCPKGHEFGEAKPVRIRRDGRVQTENRRKCAACHREAQRRYRLRKAG